MKNDSIFLPGFEPTVGSEPELRSTRTFDINKLVITPHEGEPYVLDLDLGAALPYREARQIRQLIKRLAVRKSWGRLYYRNTNSTPDGGRPGIEYLLTEKQVVLVCIACGLPDIDELISLIADVFIAWKNGRLRAVDAETEAALQEQTDRAFDQAPDVMKVVTARIDKAGKAFKQLDRKIGHVRDYLMARIKPLEDEFFARRPPLAKPRKD